MRASVDAAFGPGRIPVLVGINATADSFYSSQGRQPRVQRFQDFNEGLIAHLEATERVAGLASLEMETTTLFDLARSTAAGFPIAAAGAAIVLANRHGEGAVGVDIVAALEIAGGRAAREALTEMELGETPGSCD